MLHKTILFVLKFQLPFFIQVGLQNQSSHFKMNNIHKFFSVCKVAVGVFKNQQINFNRPVKNKVKVVYYFGAHVQFEKQNNNKSKNSTKGIKSKKLIRPKTDPYIYLLRACVCYFLLNVYFSPNDSPSKPAKNVFYFI